MPRTAFATALALCCLLVQGCVTREMVVTTDPPGATVTIDNTYTGVSPMTHRFAHYGVKGIRVEKEGYQPLYVEEAVRSPGYQKPGVDFVAEALWPGRLHDRQEFHYTLEPLGEPDAAADVMRRADEMGEYVEARARERRERDAERHPLTLPLNVKEGVREAESAAEAAEEADAPEPDGDTDDPDGDGAPDESDADDTPDEE